MGDNKNFILFAVLSLAILLGYQYLYVAPKVEKAQQQYAEQQSLLAETEVPAPREAASVDTAPETPAQASEQPAGNVTIENARVSGSLSLRGARFDDLLLSRHKVSMDKDAENVRLLAPVGDANAYYARFGWTAPKGTPEGFVPGDNTVWSADSDTLAPDNPVTLSWDNGAGVRYLMKISVDDKFMFTVAQTVINTSDQTLQLAPFGLISRKGEPKTAGLYILHEGMLGVFDGILTEKKYKEIREDGAFETSTTGGWMGITDKYWLTALVPDQQAEISRARMEHAGTEANPTYRVNYVQSWQAVAPGSTLESTNRLFAGAKIVADLSLYQKDLGITDFDKAIDWGWFWFFTRPIFQGLHFLFGLTGNYGVAILLMTVLLKLMLFPLANKSYVSMSHMKKAQPKIKAIQERYKDDKAKMQQEMMALYQKEKINPMAGCLPMIPQMFIFFALYKTLYVTIEMRHQPFFGWITDLSGPDHLTPMNLFGLIPWDPPTFMAIGVLPILMGITMWLQQKLNPQSASMDPTQAKVMSFLPIVFTFIMAGFSSGLVLYWTWNNILSVAQQWVIMRREDARMARQG